MLEIEAPPSRKKSGNGEADHNARIPDHRRLNVESNTGEFLIEEYLREEVYHAIGESEDPGDSEECAYRWAQRSECLEGGAEHRSTIPGLIPRCSFSWVG